MKKLNTLFLIATIFITLALPASAKNCRMFSAREIRQMQTRAYPTSNTQEVFKATINTLQDEGFTILNVEDELGYIRARKELKDKRVDKARIANHTILIALSTASLAMGGGVSAATSIPDSFMQIQNELGEKTIIIDANADIESFGNKTKVRLTMVEKVLYNADGYSYVKSAPRNVARIYDQAVYQNFFTNLNKSIFYEKL